MKWLILLFTRLRTWGDPVHAAYVRADTDDHRCELCHRIVTVREVVALHDDAALCCVACAELLKGARTRQGAL